MGSSHCSSEGAWCARPLFALPWCSALGHVQTAFHFGSSLFLLPPPLTYSPIVLDFYLHRYITAVPIFDLPFCLMVGILPWIGFFLPDVIFSPGIDLSYKVLSFGSNATHSSRWLLLGIVARFPHSGKTLVWTSTWTSRVMHHPTLPLTMVCLQLEEAAFTLVIS